MHFILFVLWGMGSFTAEFNNLEACMHARTVVLAKAGENFDQSRVFCVEKGLKQEKDSTCGPTWIELVK